MLKPQLAVDFDETKLKFPLMALPKIDGVRALNLTGTLTGRSLKQHKNKHTTLRFSGPEFQGLDGELSLKGQLTHPALCRLTTGEVNRIEGFPPLDWNIFDHVSGMTESWTYHSRYLHALKIVQDLEHADIRMVPFVWAYNLEDVLRLENDMLDEGYEGVILRDPDGVHKSGRATVRMGSYLRIKRFIDFEGIVESFEEAMENQNEAKVNELGRSERSSHQANLVPKGMVGNLQLRLLQDVIYRDKKLFEKDMLVTVGPGQMTHDERKFYFENPTFLLTHIAKAKLMPHGTKDKPRMATFVSLRSPEDMSE